jgi:hypothetical protein
MTQFAQMDIFFIVTTVVVVFVGLLFVIVLYRIWRLLTEVEYFMHEIREETTLLRGDIAKVRGKLQRGLGLRKLFSFGKDAFGEFTRKRKPRATRSRDVHEEESE